MTIASKPDLVEPMTKPEAEMIERMAHAIMEARVKWGWTFGKRAKVLAVDELMAEAALRAIRARIRGEK